MSEANGRKSSQTARVASEEVVDEVLQSAFILASHYSVALAAYDFTRKLGLSGGFYRFLSRRKMDRVGLNNAVIRW